MPDEENRKYLFTAIDKATRLVHLEVLASKTAEEARSFLKRYH
jgi:transposase-like protein